MTAEPLVIDMFPQEATEITAVKETNPGIRNTEQWAAFVETVMTFRNHLRAMGSDFCIIRDYELEKEMASVRRKIIYDLIKAHQDAISAAGGLVPHISGDDVAKQTGSIDDIELDSDPLQAFSPVKVWKYLQKEYTVEKSTLLANQEVTKVLIDQFRLVERHSHLPAREPKAVAGMIAFEMNCYLDNYSFGGKTEWSYSTCQDVYSLLTNLAKFCEWADDYETARDLMLHARMNQNDRAIVSRERFELGNVMLITFQNKLEVRLTKDLAEKLRLYISKFSA